MLEDMIKETSKVSTITFDYVNPKILQKKFGVPKSEMKKYDNWICEKGNYYYCKHSRYLNEFVGEYLALSFDLPTAHFEIGTNLNNLYAKSPDFREKKKKYLDIASISHNEKITELEDLKRYINENDYKEIVKHLYKLFAIDIYMRQIDRNGVNLFFCQDKKGNTSLAPIFDYSLSFMLDVYPKYSNSIMNIPINKEEIGPIFNKYPDFYNELSKTLEIDIIKLLINFTNDFDLKLTKQATDYYEKQDKISKKIIKKIL